MLFELPLKKRILSRIVFYGGAISFLWLLDFLQVQASALSTRTNSWVPAAVETVEFTPESRSLASYLAWLRED